MIDWLIDIQHGKHILPEKMKSKLSPGLVHCLLHIALSDRTEHKYFQTQESVNGEY